MSRFTLALAALLLGLSFAITSARADDGGINLLGQQMGTTEAAPGGPDVNWNSNQAVLQEWQAAEQRQAAQGR